MSNGLTLGDLRNYKFNDNANLGMVSNNTIWKISSLQYPIDSSHVTLNSPLFFDEKTRNPEEAFTVIQLIKATSKLKSKTGLYIWSNSSLYICSIWKTQEWIIFGDYNTVDLPKLPEWVK